MGLELGGPTELHGLEVLLAIEFQNRRTLVTVPISHFVPLSVSPWTEAGTACPGAGTGAGTRAKSSVDGPGMV